MKEQLEKYSIIATILSVFILSAGWSFTKFYYDRFGVGVIGIEFDLHYIAMLGFFVFMHSLVIELLFAFAILCECYIVITDKSEEQAINQPQASNCACGWLCKAADHNSLLASSISDQALSNCYQSRCQRIMVKHRGAIYLIIRIYSEPHLQKYP